MLNRDLPSHLKNLLDKEYDEVGDKSHQTSNKVSNSNWIYFPLLGQPYINVLEKLEVLQRGDKLEMLQGD